MFSGSNSFMAAGNSGRPGAPQYGQPMQYQPQQQQQQQPQPQPQPPPQQQQSNMLGVGQGGYGAGGISPQYTGFVPGGQAGFQGGQQQMPQAQQQQQPQYTGYVGQPQAQSQPLPMQQQQQQPQTGQQSMPQQSPLQTGQTSSQVAQSFQGNAPAQPTRPPASSGGTKIPSIRLSFITATDQAKFEQLFKSAVGDDTTLSADKAKDLLMRSNLGGDALAHIWTLSDTTKSGQLFFPEFALAMYLCNLKLVGKDLPQLLPEKISNEVSSMVDIISFGVPDNNPTSQARTNAPNFDAPLRQNATSPPAPQQPQPQQASNSQLLNQLTSQPTGFQQQPAGIPSQPGFGPSQLQTGFQPQMTGFQPQQTGFQQPIPQATGYQGPRPPMPPMPTGFGQNQPSSVGPMPLNAQPTGRPGHWGLVNAPSTGLPNIEALQQRMLPQPGREGGFTTAGLAGNATVPWAVTKDEKKIYDQLFKAWDGFNKGFVSGDAAIEIFGQSGLEKPDLERIWTLADHGNKGRLDLDEFSVAMHLIYRKLNGYPLPARLPPELIPPSTRSFTESIGQVKSLLSRDAESRKTTGATLLPQKTGVSYLKNHSFRNESGPTASTRKDATVFRNNDDDIGYRSSARRRLGAGGRSPSPAQPSSPSSERSNEELSVDQLRKRVREKQVLLDAIDFKDENAAEEEDALDRRDKKEARDLYDRIRNIQEDIDSHPNAVLQSGDSAAEKRALRRQLQRLTDRLPEIASQVRTTEREIAETRIELFRLRDAKAHPGSAAAIVGTGPGGTVTESDRLKARAKAMMQQRSAALTGKVAGNDEDATAAPKRLEEENSRVRTERENNDRMVRDVEDSVRDYGRSLEDSLKEVSEDSSKEHERRRWEDALGVEDEVKDFIYDLQRDSRSTRVRRDESDRRPASRDVAVKGRSDGVVNGSPARIQSPARDTPTRGSASASPAPSGNYSSYKTAEDRAAFIKQQAEQRMAERLAALGIRAPSQSKSTSSQQADREGAAREERIRRAEEEDARREQERQRRLADESVQPPTTTPKSSTKKPLPPPTRKGTKADDPEHDARQSAVDENRTRDQGQKEADLKAQQEVQEAESKIIEDEAKRQEDELAKERDASQARLKAMEDQVRQGKLKKEEEKRRKQAAQKEAKEKESRLAAHRAELEAARERERQLQAQLDQMGDDESSSDEEGPEQVEPSADATAPTTGEPTRKATSPEQAPKAPTLPSASSTESKSPPVVPASTADTETKNPFLRKLAQSGDQAQQQPQQAAAADLSTNPFHRVSQTDNAGAASSVTSQPASTSVPATTGGAPGARPSRVRDDDDDWSAFDSDDNKSDNEDEEEGDRPGTGRQNASQLASILFGTMGPPRPLSAADNSVASKSPSGAEKAPPAQAEQSQFVSAPSSPTSPPPAPPAPPIPAIAEPEDLDRDVPSSPPPPPPLPNMSAPSAPPPPPPPVPGSAPPAPPAAPPAPPAAPPAAPSAPPMPPSSSSGDGRGALLGQIQMGRALKKTQTADRSTSSTAGRVL